MHAPSGTLTPGYRIGLPSAPLQQPAPRFDLSRWPSLAGLLAVLGLLFAFGAVVRQAVRQGDSGRQASALLAEATWRCQALKLPQQRSACLGLYRQERPTDSAGVQLLVSNAEGGSRPDLP